MKVLITNMDGYNVHCPDNSAKYIEFKTERAAREFAVLVKLVGWSKSKNFLEALRDEQDV